MPSTPPFWSRPRTSIFFGAAACAACCAPPITALVVGAGAATTLASWLEPLAGVLFGLAAMIAIVAYRRYRRRAATSCAVRPPMAPSPHA
jgi:membrane protein implicated in regulation of membrane protease activity